MEFFERAHVVKSRHSSRKDSKSEENVKKQLKKMLYGYHHCDNVLIKESANAKNDFEDSSSVSGCSDLNLTNTSNECDTTHETVSSDLKDNVKDKCDLTLDESLDSNIVNENSDQSMNVESISEYDEDLKSLSEDASPDNLDGILNDASEDESDISFIVTSTDFDSTSNDESEFDADGLLAAKIMGKLGGIEKKKKTKKRKFDDLDEVEAKKIPTSNSDKHKGPYKPKEEEKGDDINMDSLSLDMSNISLPEKRIFVGPYRPKESISSPLQSLSDDISLQETHSDNLSSPPFISIIPDNMDSQSITDIIGSRQSVVRNLPSHSQNVISTKNSGLFETEEVSIIDIQDDENDSEQEEVCSLIPEVDNVPAVEELEITELETSIEPNEETPTYEDAIQSEETSERELSEDSIDATLVNPVRVFYGKNSNCIFVLKHPVEMYIHGKVQVKSLGGTIEVLGYTLQDEPCEIYAPNYNYAQYIRTVENQNAYYGLFGKLTSAGLLVSEAEEIVTSIGEHDGVICMHPLKSRQMDFVDNNFSASDLFSKPSKQIENCFKKASELLGCSLYLSKPWKSFEENVVWKQVINSGSSLIPDQQSRGIVCGGKGVGKSTFLRYYVNKLLRASGPVLVVDFDPGQCEFTVAGNVSATVVTEPLLGPNFTHLKTPEVMFNIGMINTMDNPKRYAAALIALIAHCAADTRLKNLPWIVNTMGMTNTVGLKLMSLIILQIQPTFLLQIDSRNAKKRYDFHLYPQTVKNLYFEDYQTDPLFYNIKDVNLDYAFFLSHHSDGGVKNNFSLAPKEERYLNFLAYFGSLLNTRSGGLLSIVPYEVSLRDVKIGLNVKINKAAITKVINGKVVALCQSPPDSDSVFTLNDTPLRCLGAGLIRGIDWQKEVLYIITPVAAARLAEVDCLVYADWAPEVRGPDLVRPVPAGAPLPYRTAANYQQRQFMFAPKRRFNPLQLLKMSRSA